MAILWCGGEYIDFSPFVGTIDTDGNKFRTGYARCTLSPVTSNIWQPAEVDALQIAFESAD